MEHQDLDLENWVLSAAMGASPEPHAAKQGDQEALEMDPPEDDKDEESDCSQARPRDKAAKRSLQGRFSGRLETKVDEKKLVEECRLLGPLLGGSGKRGERSRLTLARIVRGIASGEIRKHCAEREGILQRLRQQSNSGSAEAEEVARLAAENAELRAKLSQAADSGQAQPAHTEPSGGQWGPVKTEASHGTPALPTLSQMQEMQLPPIITLSRPPGEVPLQSPWGLDPPTPAPTPAASGSGMGSQMTQPLMAPVNSEAQVLATEAAQLQTQASNLTAHASLLAAQSQQVATPAAQQQVACQAHSFQAKAESLEKAAQAQSLQAQAAAHAQAQAQAQAAAQQYVVQANAHAQAHQHANLQVVQLESAPSVGSNHSEQLHSKAQQLQSEAHEHASAQSQLVTAAQQLSQTAAAHMHAKMNAQQQAQMAAAQSHQYDAQAQQLQIQAQMQAQAAPAPLLQHAAPVAMPGLPGFAQQAAFPGSQPSFAFTGMAPGLSGPHSGLSGVRPGEAPMGMAQLGGMQQGMQQGGMQQGMQQVATAQLCLPHSSYSGGGQAGSDNAPEGSGGMNVLSTSRQGNTVQASLTPQPSGTVSGSILHGCKVTPSMPSHPAMQWSHMALPIASGPMHNSGFY